jgi:hypothetical protein
MGLADDGGSRFVSREDERNPGRQVIGTNYFQVQNGKIVYMRTIHDSLPFQPFTSQSTR